MPDITTQPSSTCKNNIALLYGAPLASELLEIPMTVLKPEEKLGAKVQGWVSNANSNWARKGGWILFINRELQLASHPFLIHIWKCSGSSGVYGAAKSWAILLTLPDRLVDSGKIKKAIDSLYTAYLPKGSSPWAYLR